MGLGRPWPALDRSLLRSGLRPHQTSDRETLARQYDLTGPPHIAASLREGAETEEGVKQAAAGFAILIGQEPVVPEASAVPNAVAEQQPGLVVEGSTVSSGQPE
jgi:hypothetical protein